MYQYYALPMALRIKHLRTTAGLSQSDLAEMASISRSQLSEIENEAKPANTRRLSAIAAALGVQVEDLFDKTSDKPLYLIELEGLLPQLSSADRDALLRLARTMAASGPSGEPQ